MTPIESAWKCYACGYIGRKSEFPTHSGCPKCKSEDVFPHRMFRCARGHVADQNAFFPDEPLDLHPLEENWDAKPCEECKEEYGDYEPAKLEEVPFVFSV